MEDPGDLRVLSSAEGIFWGAREPAPSENVDRHRIQDAAQLMKAPIQRRIMENTSVRTPGSERKRSCFPGKRAIVT